MDHDLSVLHLTHRRLDSIHGQLDLRFVSGLRSRSLMSDDRTVHLLHLLCYELITGTVGRPSQRRAARQPVTSPQYFESENVRRSPPDRDSHLPADTIG